MGRIDDTEYPNKYPEESKAPGFKSWMDQYFAKVHGLAMELMRALELALDLPKDSLVDRCKGHASELRMLYYPEVHRDELADGKSMRIWPHTDFGILTLLVQGSTGGLQIEDPPQSGKFVGVPLVEKTELLINVGDTLERWTNGRVPAGLHRVTASNDDETEEIIPERYSVAFLFKANRQTSAGPIPLFVPEGTTSKYEEMTALEYHRRRTAVMLY
jgi:isopenicillin N synthase-like dioxygenase